MVEVAKRLSFGDQSLHWPEFVQVHEVLKAVSQPSIENFNRFVAANSRLLQGLGVMHGSN